MTTLQHLTGQLAAVRVGTGHETHAGYRISMRGKARYTPACGAGSRRSYGRGGGITRPACRPEGGRITCRRCERKDPSAVAELNAAADRAVRNDCLMITQHLPAFVAALATTIRGDYPSDYMTCNETDALALVLLAGGKRAAAVNLIASHSTSDKGADDTHRIPRHGDAMRAAEDYVRDLIRRHCKGWAIETHYDGDPIDLTFTVQVWERDSSPREGWVYVLHAPNPQRAAVLALEIHMDGFELELCAEDYETAVAPGLPNAQVCHWNDYRLATAASYQPRPRRKAAVAA